MNSLPQVLRRLRLQTLLFTFLVVFGSLPVMFAALSTSGRTRGVLESSERISLSREAEALSQRVNSRLSAVAAQLDQLTAALAGLDGADELASVLDSVIRRAPPGFALVLEERRPGGRRMAPNAGLPRAVSEGLTSALGEASPETVSPHRLIASGDDTWVVLPVRRVAVGNFEVLLAGAMPLDLRGASDQEVFLLDSSQRDPRVLWSQSSIPQVLHRAVERSPVIRDTLVLPGTALPVVEYPLRVGSNERTMIGQLAAIVGTDWTVLVQKRKEAALEAARNTGRNILLTGLVTVLLALLGGSVAARLLSAPFARLSALSREIASGRFGAQVQEEGASREITELTGNFNQMSQQIASSVDQLRAAARENRELFLGSVRALLRAVEAKEPYTRGHSERVAAYSQAIARRLGASIGQHEDLWLAGLLHDVGKIGIRDQVLNKGDVLTDEEFEEMKRHPVIGAEIMTSIDALGHVLPAIRSHHERWVGGGYPDGLVGEDIPMSARIVAVADTFDAVTTQRVYQNPFSIDEALGIIRKLDGKNFDPQVVAAFFNAYDDGEIAVIPNDHVATPVEAPAEAPVEVPADRVKSAQVMHT